MAPGSLVFTGDRKMEESHITIIQYNESTFREKTVATLDDLALELDEPGWRTWINIDGIHDEKTIEKAGIIFGLHRLTLEDILTVGQRAKIDEHADYLYAVLKMFTIAKDSHNIEDEQISFILKENLLITFQERTGDVFEHVRNRIKEAKGNVVRKKCDYLLYALIDSVVDHYFLILENLGEKIDEEENRIFEQSDDSNIKSLYDLKREILYLRRSVYPIRELVSALEKADDNRIAPENKIFIRDLYDHTIQIIENIEVLRDMISSITDLHMNNLSYKMNTVMKVLTIIATIFIPLTFIVGIYGMNFENMPELTWKYGYHGVMILMLALALLMVYFFRKKKWL